MSRSPSSSRLISRIIQFPQAEAGTVKGDQGEDRVRDKGQRVIQLPGTAAKLQEAKQRKANRQAVREQAVKHPAGKERKALEDKRQEDREQAVKHPVQAKPPASAVKPLRAAPR
jgi:hypothetical protein